MAKEDLINGLLLALQKGESLEKAMMSFYTAGYSKADIEEAAKEVVAIRSHTGSITSTPNTPKTTNNKVIQKPPVNNEKKGLFSWMKSKPKPAQPNVVKPLNQPTPPVAQSVSKYEGKSLKNKRLLILILIIIIFLILAGIVALLFYGNDILNAFIG